MGFFSSIFGSGKNSVKDSSARIVETIIAKTNTEYIKIIPTVNETKPMDSKFGGIPYMPSDFIYPCDRTEGLEETPLRFLAQINFSQIPELHGFPKEGILQFYIRKDSDLGVNFENLTEQKAFRVLYHENIDKNADLKIELPFQYTEKEDEMFPINGELKLNFQKESMGMSGSDFRFDKLLLKAYNESHPNQEVPSLDRVSENVLDDVYDQLESNGSVIGGYPTFTQIDPRDYNPQLQEHTTLLLQIDSVENDDFKIMWGDMGVCNFFIKPEDLKNKNFEDVIYSWDCC